ncbi:MAG: hypothetical protein E6K79_09095 [Candidatus Eisenbacteria bacterium]|uniref:Transporter n=1 Tax=Eiseniibacteriota bacterium TaxID=2212470 RepID=A0A538TJJ9_UNCEI|nr:MAG: hypothetical protein E6K79_09095 [Candidatus Eisenbacteria bacterium]
MFRRTVAGSFLAAAILVTTAAPAGAEIVNTKRPGQNKGLALTVGSGLEYETDGEEAQYGFPFLVEYGFTEMLKLSVEPSYVVVRKKDGDSITGPGDLEATVTWEFPTERRYLPGFALEGVVKFPTARRGDLGTGEADYSIGAIVTKELVPFDLDLNAVYTFVGSPPGVHLQNTFEASLAAEWHLTTVLDIEAEVVTSTGAGGRFHGQAGSLGSLANIGGAVLGQSESEGTLGFAEHLSDRFELEEGMILKSDGSWQAVAGWEFDFGEGR